MCRCNSRKDLRRFATFYLRLFSGVRTINRKELALAVAFGSLIAGLTFWLVKPPSVFPAPPAVVTAAERFNQITETRGDHWTEVRELRLSVPNNDWHKVLAEAQRQKGR